VSETAKKRSGRVWDPLVRLFHWTLAGAFATAWFIRSEASIHQTAGQIVLILIIFRTAWGIVGTGSARFGTFIKGPLTTLRYVFSILRGKPAHYLGHNPAGAAMIGALLLSLTATTVSGILMTTSAFWGGEWIEWVHGTAATLSIVLIAGHLLGVLAACIQHRENLPWSMITGRKTVSVNTERFLGPTMFTRKRLLAVMALIASSFGVWGASNAALNASFWRMPKMIIAGAAKIGCEAARVSAPRLVVYPAVEFQYDVEFAGGGGRSMATIPASLALERRPKIQLPALQDDCGAIVQTRYLQEHGAHFGDVAGLLGDIAQGAAEGAIQLAALPASRSAVWSEPGDVLADAKSEPAAGTSMKPNSVVTDKPQSVPADDAITVRLSKPRKKTVSQAIPRKAPAKAERVQKVKAKPVKRKAKKPLRILRPSSVRTQSSRQFFTQSQRRDYGASSSDNSGHGGGSGGSNSSGPGSGDSGSGFSNSGSGSGNSGSGSGNGGSGGGGGDSD
jgi:cytochrome b